MDDTHACIPTDCEGGNSTSAIGVGDNMPLVAVDLGRQPESVECSPHLEFAIPPGDVRRFLMFKVVCHEMNHFLIYVFLSYCFVVIYHLDYCCL